MTSRETHLSDDTAARLRRGALPAEELRAALGHLSSCAECAGAMREASAAEVARVREVLEDAAVEAPRHLPAEELIGWVDGTLDAATQASAADHLAECELCQEDAADLQRLRVRGTPRRTRLWLAAAAVLTVGFVAALLFVPREAQVPSGVKRATLRPPRIETPRYANAGLQKLVDEALNRGRLSFPQDLGELRGDPDTLRGGAPAAPSLIPSGVVIDETQPELRWPRVAGASYVVAIYDGDEEVLRSPSLREERWTASPALRRGRMYAWQVEARSTRGLTILPTPPAPPAKFRITGARDHEELAAAPAGDHLLRAVLYARAGMTEQAAAEMRLLPPSPDPRVERLRTNTLSENAAR